MPKKDITEEGKRYIKRKVQAELKDYDLEKWQQACSSFAPFRYKRETRKKWFQANEDRVETGKEIIEFYDRMVREIREAKKLYGVRVSDIREAIVDAIRDEQTRRGFHRNRINAVKIATFRTLLRWAREPDRLDEGPYHGEIDVPEHMRMVRFKRGRKKAKGAFMPPEAKLVHSVKTSGADRFVLIIRLSNKYIHAIQRVELELELDERLKVENVREYRWNPNDRRIIVGFIPASLDVEPFHVDIPVEIRVIKRAKSYSISASIHYDDTDRGVRMTEEVGEETIRVR